MKDHGLRLFGKIIQLKVNQVVKDYNDDNNDCDYECTSSCDNFKQDQNRGYHEKSLSQEELKETEQPGSKKGSNSSITEDAKPVSNDKDSKQDDIDQTSSSNSHDQKTLKKPDKILPCPRCNSMSTKFCYFNNYNVNQPRHFCKDCQRYWTAGGTMRNVPVGAGRRKSKSSASSQHRHFVDSYGFVQDNVNTNSMLFENQQLPWQSGFFPASICSTSIGNRNLQSHQFDMTSNSPNSPSTRKHSRDGTTEDEESENTRAVIRKTSMVDDPIEAASSSIWNTLQIKNANRVSPPIAKGGFFGGVLKFDGNSSGEASPIVLEFNTAAFSRSLSFHETAR